MPQVAPYDAPLMQKQCPVRFVTSKAVACPARREKLITATPNTRGRAKLTRRVGVGYPVSKLITATPSPRGRATVDPPCRGRISRFEAHHDPRARWSTRWDDADSVTLQRTISDWVLLTAVRPCRACPRMKFRCSVEAGEQQRPESRGLHLIRRQTRTGDQDGGKRRCRRF